MHRLSLRLSASAFFDKITDRTESPYDTVAKAKSYLCKKHGLTAEQADLELDSLMDYEAELLSHAYHQGMRGNDIRGVKHQHDDFLKRMTDLIYSSGQADQYFLRMLTSLIHEGGVTPAGALEIMLNVALQKPEEIKTRVNYLVTEQGMSHLDAVDLLGGLTEHDAQILLYFVRENKLAPEAARAKFFDKADADILEMRMIEAPGVRPLRFV